MGILQKNLYCELIWFSVTHYGKTGHNRPTKSVGYEEYRSVISLKPTDMAGRLNPGRLRELVGFNP